MYNDVCSDNFLEEEELLSTHALVRFVEEDCTAVVPLQRITGDLQQGELVDVLWDNRKEYSGIFLLSGKVLSAITYVIVKIKYV